MEPEVKFEKLEKMVQQEDPQCVEVTKYWIPAEDNPTTSIEIRYSGDPYVSEKGLDFPGSEEELIQHLEENIDQA